MKGALSHTYSFFVKGILLAVSWCSAVDAVRPERDTMLELTEAAAPTDGMNGHDPEESSDWKGYLQSELQGVADQILGGAKVRMTPYPSGCDAKMAVFVDDQRFIVVRCSDGNEYFCDLLAADYKVSTDECTPPDSKPTISTAISEELSKGLGDPYLLDINPGDKTKTTGWAYSSKEAGKFRKQQIQLVDGKWIRAKKKITQLGNYLWGKPENENNSDDEVSPHWVWEVARHMATEKAKVGVTVYNDAGNETECEGETVILTSGVTEAVLAADCEGQVQFCNLGGKYKYATDECIEKIPQQQLERAKKVDIEKFEEVFGVTPYLVDLVSYESNEGFAYFSIDQAPRIEFFQQLFARTKQTKGMKFFKVQLRVDELPLISSPTPLKTCEPSDDDGCFPQALIDATSGADAQSSGTEKESVA
eukprot:TRINITY_DN35907_c0_g1_i1.p1 TRINITY_DN35907_c0_g1~~TRINITY_DN35907_c0_g1_i1.p1  ORF type:complete len:420 (-),score=85.78 TRINITY_DN35907_c0_g1_i1:26-1285(-)